MLSITSSSYPIRNFAAPMGLAVGVLALTPSAAQAQSFLGTTGGFQVVCTSSGGNLVIRDSTCAAGDPGLQNPTGFEVGNATFNDPSVGPDSTIFSGSGSVLINVPLTVTAPADFNGTSTFGGFSVTFNTDTTFNDPSTFDALADFNNGITSNTITNSGTINSANVNVTGSLTAAPGTTVNMGGVNRIQGVADGINDLDAVNVGQLNAATSGITTDVTALETLTAAHSTQITTLETTTATHTTQITALETTTATHTTQIAAHTAQISALEATDAAFESRLDALDAVALDLDERIDVIDDRASAGTAAAVALSGAMFLPGKSFNLTGNVGAYRGAVAGALQLGALVNDGFAVNAGVAHGFNKGGKTAVRAGFTIGW